MVTFDLASCFFLEFIVPSEFKQPKVVTFDLPMLTFDLFSITHGSAKINV